MFSLIRNIFWVTIRVKCVFKAKTFKSFNRGGNGSVSIVNQDQALRIYILVESKGIEEGVDDKFNLLILYGTCLSCLCVWC